MKKYLYIGFSLMLALLLSSCGSKVKNIENIQNTNQNTEQNTDKQRQLENNIYKNKKTEWENNDFEKNKIETNNSVSKDNTKEEKIKQIDDLELFDSILKDKAWMLCDKIKDNKLRSTCNDLWTKSYAIVSWNVKLCKKIKDKWIRKDCIVYAKQAISEQEIERKYDEIIKNKDWEKCKDFEEPLKSNCINESYYDKALKEKNKTICEKISDREFRINCIKKVK